MDFVSGFRIGIHRPLPFAVGHFPPEMILNPKLDLNLPLSAHL
jgi:hypothetical protein